MSRNLNEPLRIGAPPAAPVHCRRSARRPGTSNTPITIGRPMRLKRSGGSGVVTMRNSLYLAAILIVPVSAAAQRPVLPDHQADDPAPAIDGAWFPIVPGAKSPGPRIAPDAVVDVFILPETRPAAPDATPEIAGYIEDLPPGLAPAPNWTPTAAGGHVWTVELVSGGATALRVRLRGRFGRDGLELRVYDPVGGYAFGPYQAVDIEPDEEWWTTIIFGDSIGLEFHAPPGTAFPPEMPWFDGVAYCNVEPPLGGPIGLGCGMVNVACHPEWLDSAEAVCMLATLNSMGRVVGYCTGALLNREPGDGSPLLMTANHCDPTGSATVFVWGYRSATCNAPDPDPNTFDKSAGAYLLRSDPDSDWNLLGLAEPPFSSSYLGWDAGFWGSFSDGNGIHHANRLPQKVSLGYNEGALYTEFCDSNGQNCFWAHVWGVRWTTGSTTGGASGSPVLDSDRKVRGTLTGGFNCDVGYYGRFAHAYDTLEPFLSDIPSPLYVDVNYGGKEERGTSAEPFDHLVEGIYGVVTGDRLLIRPGTYDNRVTIWRPMRLERWGNSGIVRIGGTP